MSHERSSTPTEIVRIIAPENKPGSILDFPVIREMHEAGKLKGKKAAFILDGNGRWAEEHGLSVTEGHKAGAKAAKVIMQASAELEMDLSLWILSPNNIKKRSRKEIQGIEKILRSQMKELITEAQKYNGRIVHVGETEELSLRLRYQLWRAQEKTKNNTGPILGLAINYSGDKQIIQIAKKANKEKRRTDYDAPGKIASMMYGGGLIKPVNYLIRTAGDMRLSGLEKPFTGEETELFFRNVYLPDFTVDHFAGILVEGEQRKKTLGGRNSHAAEPSKPTHRLKTLFSRK